MSIGDTLLGKGKLDEAEKIYRTARELDRSDETSLLGLIRCLCKQDREPEAIALLDEAARKPGASPSLVGQLVLSYDRTGRRDEALRLLESTRVFEIPSQTWSELVRAYVSRGKADQLWERIDPLLRSQVPASDSEPLVALLEELSEVEQEGHVPALQRLVEMHRKRGDVQGSIRALEWLVRAYQTRSMHDEASVALEKLREIAPTSAVVSTGPPREATPYEATPTALSSDRSSDGARDVEAPSVPLNRPDEEFAAGRLTQADILEKYGLLPQAVEQLEEVVSRFPGHLAALERLAAMHRATGDKKRLAEILVRLAVARRTAGDTAMARQAAGEAVASQALDAAQMQTLEQLGLAEGRAKPVAKPIATPVAKAARSGKDEFELTLDFDEAEAAPEESPEPLVEARSPAKKKDKGQAKAAIVAKAPGGARKREPTPDMLDEIGQLLESGEREEARRRIDALAVLGYASSQLEALQTQLAESPAASDGRPGPQEIEPSDEIAPSVPMAGSVASQFQEDDFDAITEALDSELFATEAPFVPAAESEESLEDILETFKERVQQEVDHDDHRTHYDLGIAFKEMGLVDEAIQEFQVAAKGADLHRDACSMIALCHRDRMEMSEAALWYRQAIESPGAGANDLSGLRYDLAEVLLLSGDTAGALDEFRGVLELDPTYRDVRGRVAELESQPQG